MLNVKPVMHGDGEESITRDGNIHEIGNEVEEGKTSADLSDSEPEDIFEGAEEDEKGIDEETGTVKFITNHFSMFAVGYASRTFDDLGKFEWARKEIEALAARGVINGIGNSLYAPEASAARGEFVKLLVNAFGLKAEFDENFDDVSEKDFFYLP
ncbi:MAG TPA: S-layer homology domain-containing protein [Clostridiaceae bacterium]|nr:S-layer homology domain-containing protein [Clostridiaceae bacterium]